MDKIYKYILDPNNWTVELPKNSNIISAESQGDNIVVYAIVNTEEKELRKVEIRVFGTGHNIDINLNYYIFLDTVKMYGGTLMFHVFYKWV
jgi:hypothetical protein